MTVSPPDALPLWTPSPARITKARLTAFIDDLQEEGHEFDDYEALWQWSVTDIDAFWRAVWEHFDLPSETPPTTMLADASMPGARWCPGTRVNLVHQVFRHARSRAPAMVYESEGGAVREVSWAQLEQQVGAMAQCLRERGVKSGDCVAAVITNVPEAVVGFLAAASLGAVWSVAAPDMGHRAVVERFEQIQPVVLLACPGYRFGGRWHDRREAVRQLLAALSSVHTLIVAPHADGGPADGPEELQAFAREGLTVLPFAAAVRLPAPLQPVWLDFEHPLWIVYSSGTTGKPKAIVHGHGGVMMMSMVTLALHNDVHADDRLLWMSSTGWIVWNVQVTALLLGATIVLTDASPMGAGGTAAPDPGTLWRLVGRQRVNLFGTGSAYLVQCMKAGLVPREVADLSSLRALGATGSPLPAETYRWAMQAVAADLHLMVVSGGTDIAGGFIACACTLPVFAGEMQCRGLGAAVQAFDPQGRPVIGEVGELVCTAPLPTMPLFFWGDADGSRYRDSYFDTWPGVWRHGDWMQLIDRRAQGGAVGAVIFGRSDATINRHGLRLGTAEIYRAIEGVPEVVDSLVVDLEYLGKPSALLLFVVLRPDMALDAALAAKLRDAVRRDVSPRFVPDEIHAMHSVPRTLTGKKLELPLRRVLLGQPAEKVLPRDTVAHPECLDEYLAFAQARAARTG